MQQYYIIPHELCAATDWQTAEHFNIAPLVIAAGPYAGQYAVNVEIFGADPSAALLRELIESCPTATLTHAELYPTEEAAQ